MPSVARLRIDLVGARWRCSSGTARRSSRQSWPVICAACAYSGVPSSRRAGAHVDIGGEAAIHHRHARPHDLRQHDAGQALPHACWASAPASVTGLTSAPARVNGVMIAHLAVLGEGSISPSAIGMSSCSGEFVLMTPVKTGSSIRQPLARRAERDRHHFQRIDRALGAQRLRLPVFVEQRDFGVIEIEMARVLAGRSSGSKGPPPFLMQDFRSDWMSFR